MDLNRFALYVNDDYRATKTLTLNLGLRYEYTFPYTEAHNAFGNFDPSTASGMVQQTGGTPLYSNKRGDFGPRVGFSWDVTGKGTTIVRAGGSILYETIDIDDVAASGFGGSLDSVPTGFGLYDCNNGLPCNGPGVALVGGKPVASPGNPASPNFVQVASPGHDKEGVVSFINNCSTAVYGRALAVIIPAAVRWAGRKTCLFSQWAITRSTAATATPRLWAKVDSP